MLKRCLTLGFLCFATACSTLPERPPDTTESYRITPQPLALPGLAKPGDPAHSAVMLLNDPREALLARLALADAAEHTIDVQYYIWAADAVGTIIVARLIKAADRGVRVRMLIDDLSLIGSDPRVLPLHNHPNIDVRAYNPFRFRKRYRILRRTLDIVSSAARINHRMHNKVFAIDNNAAIVGGRNLANSYFGAEAQQSSRDIDILAVGPVVDDVSASFDAYWNSSWAIPIDALSQQNTAVDSITTIIGRLEETSRELLSLIPPSSIDSFLPTNAHRLSWCVVEFVADPPTKTRGNKNFVSPVSQRMQELFEQSQREVLIENAYLIPSKDGVKSAARATARGVRVQILTNSLASNNSGASHAGYKKYRRSMLKAGVNLFELRPDAKLRDAFDLSTVAQMSLHSKAAVFDEKTALVGSFNLDPRSNYINTETSIIVHDSKFAKELARVLNTAVQLDNSWRLALDSNKRIEWQGPTGAQREPPSTFKKRLTARILAWLPVEWLL